MVTDAERDYAIKVSIERHLQHLKEGRSCDINHIAENLDCEEAARRGLLGECSFARVMELISVDGSIRERGDGGKDFWVPLLTKRGVPRWFKVDVKAKSVRQSWPALMASGTHLRVPVKHCVRDTIYVFAIYLEKTDDAEALRWDFGRELIEQNDRRKFPRGKGWSFVREYERLRELQELKDRFVVRRDLFD